MRCVRWTSYKESVERLGDSLFLNVIKHLRWDNHRHAAHNNSALSRFGELVNSLRHAASSSCVHLAQEENLGALSLYYFRVWLRHDDQRGEDSCCMISKFNFVFASFTRKRLLTNRRNYIVFIWHVHADGHHTLCVCAWLGSFDLSSSSFQFISPLLRCVVEVVLGLLFVRLFYYFSLL